MGQVEIRCRLHQIVLHNKDLTYPFLFGRGEKREVLYMATNENVNKVIYGNQTVMDITDTTAEESDVASGEVFYKADGARSVGTLNADSAVWGNISGTLSDQTDLQIELNRAYTKTASETSSIDDLDVIPVQKISASSDGRRNIKFRNLKSILKTYFDNIYSTFSGSFNDLSDKPTIDQTYSATSSNAQSGKAVAEVVEQIYADNGVLGAKNLLKIFNMSYSGIDTFVNSDGSITSRGTKASSGGSNFRILEPNKFMLPIGKYKLSLSGTPADKGLRLSLVPSTGDWITKAIVTNGNEVEFEITSADLDKTISMFFVPVEAGTVIDWTYYPMLRLASDPDDTYVPYAMTNRELTEKVFEKRTLTSADDLNNITETGIYTITSAPVNSPENVSYCSLLVQAQDSYNIRQIVFKNSYNTGSIYTRDKGGSPSIWHSWRKFTGTVVS